MKYVFTIAIALISFSSVAQNYDCLQFGPKNYFINGNGYVRGIRVDSVRSNAGDTIFYPYRTQRISNYLYGPGTFQIDTLGGSWLGKKVIKQADGTFLFDNLWDTVVIKTRAHTGDSWIFYNDTSIFSYTATVTAEDTMTVLGIPDSIKKITITAYKAGVVSGIDPVNNFQMILSKKNGFIQVFDLYTFPYHMPDTLSFDPIAGRYHIRWFDYYLDLLLNNLGTCDLGCVDYAPDATNSIFHLFPFYNPTTMEIYDFAIGDVYETEWSVGGGGSSTDIFTLDSIMTKITTAYNVSYGGTEHKMQWYYPLPGPPIITYPSASFSVPGGDTNKLINPSVMPEEWNAPFLLHYFSHDLTNPCIGNTYEIDDDYKGGGFYDDGSGFFVPSISDSSFSIGLGMVGMYRASVPVFGATFNQAYLFFHKDTITCGSLLNVLPSDTLIDTNKTILASAGLNNNIHILPNPAYDHIDITSSAQFDNNTSISVYDVTGRCVYSVKAEETKNTMALNTLSWSSGLYIVIVQNNAGVINRQKIIILK